MQRPGVWLLTMRGPLGEFQVAAVLPEAVEPFSMDPEDVPRLLPIHLRGEFVDAEKIAGVYVSPEMVRA